MPTIPNIGQMTEQSKNPSVQPSATDLLMAAATTSSMADAAKQMKPKPKPKGKGK